MTLNESAMILADELIAQAESWRCSVSTVGGARVIDCGGAVVGGLQAGLQMARICTAGLADVSLQFGSDGPMIQLASDDPIPACLASQYAGWQIKGEKFFAMGSGPMRAAAGREAIFEHIPGKEQPPCAVGVLESRKHPTEEVVAYLVSHLPATVERITLLVAPASSIAGTIQVVARSLETALHKLHELKFNLRQVVSGFGVAPLPPVAADEGKAIGWTNDAILYGGRVVLWVRADDEILDQVGPKVPSSASPDHGAPFADIFQRYGGDFYKIDPMLFSPAAVEFRNLKTGRVHAFGRIEPDLLRRSFGR
ncbi:MAG TPA: methenyltetrahydromethanopterin cyclohydrolase [Gemmataceae bacterium]|nr:methenyltetrahydromethanopterin cyclohydrolase [Gemmataceae bacterium]